MRYILATVNTELRENPFDKVFSSMDSLLAFVEDQGFEWTSIMVTILPAKAKKKAVKRKRSPRFLGSM